MAQLAWRVQRLIPEPRSEPAPQTAGLQGCLARYGGELSPQRSRQTGDGFLCWLAPVPWLTHLAREGLNNCKSACSVCPLPRKRPAFRALASSLLWASLTLTTLVAGQGPSGPESASPARREPLEVCCSSASSALPGTGFGKCVLGETAPPCFSQPPDSSVCRDPAPVQLFQESRRPPGAPQAAGPTSLTVQVHPTQNCFRM